MGPVKWTRLKLRSFSNKTTQTFQLWAILLTRRRHSRTAQVWQQQLETGTTGDHNYSEVRKNQKHRLSSLWGSYMSSDGCPLGPPNCLKSLIMACVQQPPQWLGLSPDVSAASWTSPRAGSPGLCQGVSNPPTALRISQWTSPLTLIWHIPCPSNLGHSPRDTFKMCPSIRGNQNWI